MGLYSDADIKEEQISNEIQNAVSDQERHTTKELDLIKRVISRSYETFLTGKPEEDIEVYQLAGIKKGIEKTGAKIYNKLMSKKEYDKAFKHLQTYEITSPKRQAALQAQTLFKEADKYVQHKKYDEAALPMYYLNKLTHYSRINSKETERFDKVVQGTALETRLRKMNEQLEDKLSSYDRFIYNPKEKEEKIHIEELKTYTESMLQEIKEEKKLHKNYIRERR